MNPANGRKTPFTEEEIDTFVQDFILDLDEREWLLITAEHGEEKARKKQEPLSSTWTKII